MLIPGIIITKAHYDRLFPNGRVIVDRLFWKKDFDRLKFIEYENACGKLNFMGKLMEIFRCHF